MTEILLAGKSHITSQKKIFKSSLKILNSKSADKVINVILSDFKTLLDCEIINCFSTDNSNTIQEVQKIDDLLQKVILKKMAL